MLKKPELLIPAGSLEKLKTAIFYGADAVYIGTPDLSLRTKSTISLDELIEGVNFVHAHGKKIYLTLNLFSHNKDIEKLPAFVDTIKKAQPDGVIVADPGVFSFLKENFPELELHISTQANICSWLSVKFWQDQGAALCVMARETSFAELSEIRAKCPDIKLEAFIHGSMCMTYSGRCLLSNFMSERGANQGNCAHSCRWNYKLKLRLKDGTIKELEINEDNADLFEFLLEEEYRPGDFLPFEEDFRGSYILNSKDLCLMPKLPEYLKLGIDSLKVEGRNKSQYYVAIVTRTYRMAIDDWYEDPQNWSAKKYMAELDTLANRGYSLAFHDGRLTNLAHNYDSSKSSTAWEFAGIIDDVNEQGIIIAVKNRLEAGDILEFTPAHHKETILLRIYEFNYLTKDTSETITKEVINPGQNPQIFIPFSSFSQEDPVLLKQLLQKYTVLRKAKPLTEIDQVKIKLDHEAQKLELDKGSHKIHQKNKDKLINLIQDEKGNKAIKTPRLGKEGCCGRGCNGCLIFWHDDKYIKARKLLLEKKQGVRLESAING